jgi:hypothetical protein
MIGPGTAKTDNARYALPLRGKQIATQLVPFVAINMGIDQIQPHHAQFNPGCAAHRIIDTVDLQGGIGGKKVRYRHVFRIATGS